MIHHNPRKRFGQNFLCDPFVIDRIINAIHPLPEDYLVEIGPGLGALTKPMLTIHSPLTAIEIDRDLIPQLRTQFSLLGLTLIEADALTVDFAQIALNKQKLRIFGNLPYNISTPLLFHLLAQIDVIQDMHFMLQKEVVDRIIAVPGTKHYGRLSIMLQYYCQATCLFYIGAEAFKPAPKVESAFLRLTPHSQLPFPAKNIIFFGETVKQAFAQRRKTLKNNLAKLCSADQLRNIGIDPSLRPEQIALADYVKISNFLSK